MTTRIICGMLCLLVLNYGYALLTRGNGLAHFPPKIPKKTLGMPRPLQCVYVISSIMTMQTTSIILKYLLY